MILYFILQDLFGVLQNKNSYFVSLPGYLNTDQLGK